MQVWADVSASAKWLNVGLPGGLACWYLSAVGGGPCPCRRGGRWGGHLGT